jgi:hypothetical protein
VYFRSPDADHETNPFVVSSMLCDILIFVCPGDYIRDCAFYSTINKEV